MLSLSNIIFLQYKKKLIHKKKQQLPDTWTEHNLVFVWITFKINNCACCLWLPSVSRQTRSSPTCSTNSGDWIATVSSQGLITPYLSRFVSQCVNRMCLTLSVYCETLWTLINQTCDLSHCLQPYQFHLFITATYSADVHKVPTQTCSKETCFCGVHLRKCIFELYGLHSSNMRHKTLKCDSPFSVVIFLFYFFYCVILLIATSLCLHFFFFRGRLATWLKAVTMPETGPGLLSSHMSMKKSSRVLRHMHVSSKTCFFNASILLFFLTTTILVSTSIFRFHKFAGQLWNSNGCVWDSDVRGAKGEQTLHWRYNGDKCHEGPHAVLLFFNILNASLKGHQQMRVLMNNRLDDKQNLSSTKITCSLQLISLKAVWLHTECNLDCTLRIDKKL